MAVKTGVLTIEEVYPDHILEAIRDQNYFKREITHVLKRRLGQELSDHFYTDHREFFVWVGEVEELPKDMYNTVFVLVGLLLLHDPLDCAIGEYAIADETRWQSAKNGNYVVVMYPPVAVVSPITDTLTPFQFKPVSFLRRDDIVYAWERVS